MASPDTSSAPVSTRSTGRPSDTRMPGASASTSQARVRSAITGDTACPPGRTTEVTSRPAWPRTAAASSPRKAGTTSSSAPDTTRVGGCRGPDRGARWRASAQSSSSTSGRKPQMDTTASAWTPDAPRASATAPPWEKPATATGRPVPRNWATSSPTRPAARRTSAGSGPRGPVPNQLLVPSGPVGAPGATTSHPAGTRRRAHARAEPGSSPWPWRATSTPVPTSKSCIPALLWGGGGDRNRDAFASGTPRLGRRHAVARPPRPRSCSHSPAAADARRPRRPRCWTVSCGS